VKTRKKRIFNLSQRGAWERVFRCLLADKVNDTVIAEVRRINPRHLRDDGFAWLNTATVVATKQLPEDIPTLLASRLSDYYESLIAFHATRAPSPDDFLTHGIMLSEKKAQQEFARNFFGNSEAIENAIIELRGYERLDQASIFLSLTKEVFFREYKHYLLSGSEYLSGIANRLNQISKLRENGKPMIVECILPASILPQEFWHRLSRNILERYFSKLLRPAEKQWLRTSDVAITQPVSPESIRFVHEYVEVKRTGCYEDNSFRLFKTWDGKARS